MKKIHVTHFILAALFLALIVQVFNTSSLYMSFSHLDEPYKQIAGYFIGLSAEFSIFICIYSGSRAAGGWFAIITFFCGILFHHHWQEVVINFHTHEYYFPNAFLSSTLLQFMNSILVWFLSELFIEKKKVLQLPNTIAQMENEVNTLLNHVEDIEVKIIRRAHEYDQLETTIFKMKKEVTESEQKKEKLQQEIITLQKKKAGASRGVETT